MGCKKLQTNFLRVVHCQKGSSAKKNVSDYFSFGMPMPNRQLVNGEPYRYAYQGQEKDPETGKEAFQLRLWDSRIGRWLTTDPKGEFASPYLGMGNNPMRLIDPDGGSTDDIIIRTLNSRKNLSLYQEYIIIKSDKIHKTIDVPVYVEDFVNTSKVPFIYDKKIGNLYAVDALYELVPDAISVNLTGEVAFKGGFQGGLSATTFLKGPDSGHTGIYGSTGALAGLEGSFSLTMSFIYASDISKFGLESMGGFTQGAQVSIFGLNGDVFQGFSRDLNLFNVSPFTGISLNDNFLSKTIIYEGISVGGSLGIPELGGSASMFLEYSELLFDTKNDD